MSNVACIRVSTSEQAESGLGLKAQIEKIEQYCTLAGETIDKVFCDEGVSASTLDRPAMNEALRTIHDGDSLFVSRLCRLSRSVSDFALMCERSHNEGWSLVIVDPLMDLRSAAGRFTANVLASVAQFERDMISQRTKEALQVKREQGVRLGRPPEVSSHACDIAAHLARQDLSLSAIARELNDREVPTPRGGMWTHVTVKRMLAR